ncbi:iron-containing redox enzyme family protein [Nocardioides taihuensis]|uniref:Iron-containing redox enzyme family protein n=1 Tax=Nocardioides taihuensis TaxID=1835606 RepID=A0ABW0BJW9_9ACTN
MLLPRPRGSLSESVFDQLRRFPDEPVHLAADPETFAPDSTDDAAITLWVLHELHHRGFEDVDPAMEWHPALAPVRHRLDGDLEQTLRARFPGTPEIDDPADPASFAEAFFAYVAGHDGSSLAAHVHRHADEEQVLELLRWRSVYHLKEADPTTWVLPRLPAPAQAALAEVQYDEYGAGAPGRVHRELFARAMAACGLRPEHGAYVDEVPAEVLEQNAAMTLFGLHRRLRGAAVGHFAAFEATSSLPSRRMALGLERLGLAQELVDYYSEHVEADAVHEQLAVRSLAGTLLADEPQLLDDVFLGAFSCLDLEDRVAGRFLERQGVAA